ncbi:MAG: hypothetical protein WBW92_00250 [Rhodanobacteraceae bacterium]
MRWILLVIAVAGLFGSWWSTSPVWFGLGLATGILASIAAALAFAQARIENSAQPEFMTDPEIEALRSAVRQKTKTDSEGVSTGMH